MKQSQKFDLDSVSLGTLKVGRKWCGVPGSATNVLLIHDELTTEGDSRNNEGCDENEVDFEDRRDHKPATDDGVDSAIATIGATESLVLMLSLFGTEDECAKKVGDV